MATVARGMLRLCEQQRRGHDHIAEWRAPTDALDPRIARKRMTTIECGASEDKKVPVYIL